MTHPNKTDLNALVEQVEQRELNWAHFLLTLTVIFYRLFIIIITTLSPRELCWFRACSLKLEFFSKWNCSLRIDLSYYSWALDRSIDSDLMSYQNPAIIHTTRLFFINFMKLQRINRKFRQGQRCSKIRVLQPFRH